MSDHVTPAQDPPARAPRPPPRSAISWCGIPDFPYAIRISEFGIRDSETGVQEIFMVRYFPS